MIKLVVFDWNGTLLADTKACVDGVNKQLEVLNRAPINLKDYQERYDVPHWHFYKTFGIEPKEIKEKSLQIAEAFHAEYEPKAAHARTRSGTRSLLEELATKNITRIVLSNHTIEGIYLHLERLKLTHHFDVVLANENIGMGHFKGKQEKLEKYMEMHAVQPSSVVIVGDTIEEIRIGKNLGLKTIAITGGYNSTKRLRATKPDVLVHSLHEIILATEEF